MTDLLGEINRDNQWNCRICGQRWVVPDLARTCERKHDEATRPEPQ